MKSKKPKFSDLKASKAAHLLDKNSRTMTKIIQLLNVIQTAKCKKNDDRMKPIKEKVELLKSRLRRRLNKLAVWADTPLENRRPESRNSLNKTNQLLNSNSFSDFNRAYLNSTTRR